MIQPLRIAHRGASGAGLAPENTLAAFERAIQIGVDAIEIDVHATRDNQLVVLHDSTLDRTTNASGAVRDLTLEQVRAADAGSWCGDRYRGERVPTLQEVLELARHRVTVLMEVKAELIAERTLGVIADMRSEDQVVIQSFSRATVERVKLMAPSQPAALLVGKLPTSPSRLRARRVARELLDLRANALAIWHGALTPAFFDEMRRWAITVWTWTVDEEADMHEVVVTGVQGVITNYPDRLNHVLEGLTEDGRLSQTPRRRLPGRGRWTRRRRLRRAAASRVS